LRDNLPRIELARSLDYRIASHPADARLVRVQRSLRGRGELAALRRLARGSQLALSGPGAFI
jgi:hypothetical protein